MKWLRSKCFLSFSIKFWLIANKKRNGFFSAIVLWIVKNDPFALLSLTKIRNIVNFVKKSDISNESADFDNFNYIKISKKINIKRKNNMTPHYSSQVWEFLAKFCKIMVIFYQVFIL